VIHSDFHPENGSNPPWITVRSGQPTGGPLPSPVTAAPAPTHGVIHTELPPETGSNPLWITDWAGPLG
jgi:hypothetical protein